MTHKKHLLLNESIIAQKRGYLPIITLIGGPGLSKTYLAQSYTKKNNLNYEHISSYTTPLSFYEKLYKNRNGEGILCDDLSGTGHPIILGMIKAIGWPSKDGKRIVSYHSTTSRLKSLGLPESFEFKANIILIFNEKIKGYEPITNRGITIEFNFTFEEKLQIFEEIKEAAKIEDEVLEYVKANCNAATENLSIRSLVILSKVHRNKQDFKLFAEEMLKIDEDKNLLLTLNAQDWSDKTGYHKRTYYKRKRRIGK